LTRELPKQILIAKDGKQKGPFSEGQVRSMLTGGFLAPGDLCWHDGLPAWLPVSQILGSVAVPPTIPPSLPASSRPRTASVQYAGFWIRVGAYFIDTVVMVIPICLFGYLYRAATPASTRLEHSAVDLVANLYTSIIWWIYCAVLESSVWQGTIGKKVLGLKVTDLDGQRISFGRATGRYFSLILSALPLCIGFMMVGWTQRKQGLHDMIAGTFVVRQQ
jgi:uncharacterized RDD family membrane protein YckC